MPVKTNFFTPIVQVNALKNKNKKTSGNLVKRFQSFETFEFKTMNG